MGDVKGEAIPIRGQHMVLAPFEGYNLPRLCYAFYKYNTTHSLKHKGFDEGAKCF